MIQRPQMTTRTDPLVSYTTLLRSAEDVHRQELVADDVDPDEEHAGGERLRPDELGHPEFLFADFHRHRLAAGMDVAPDVVLGADPAERRIFVADAQRPSVHQEEAAVALGGLDRKRVVWGTSVAVCVDPGGSRYLKKKK